MTTITINPITKAGKTLLELANLLAISNKGVFVDVQIDVSVPAIKNQLLKDFETACKQLKQSKLKKTKRKSLDDLLNEK